MTVGAQARWSDPAREAAWNALTAFDEGRIDRVADGLPMTLDPRDAGLARELVLGATRHGVLYDHLALSFLRKGHQPPQLARALRLACHQLFALDRIPPHAVGDTTVELLRWAGEPRLAGVANAVVRKLAGLQLPTRGESGPLGRLVPSAVPADPAIRYSLPRLLIDDLATIIAERGIHALAALNHLPPLCTRSRPGKTPTVGRSILKREGAFTWWEEPTEALGWVSDGQCVVQDRSQAAAIETVRPRPGELVADLCAAPGGKAAYLRDLGCTVIAGDSSRRRLADLRDTSGGAVLAQDGRRPALAVEAFDVVVVDAPCSNTGVLARRPEARLRYDRKHLDQLGALQRGLLRAASRLVHRDGRLLYATCSLSPRENQAITHGFDGWRILAETCTWPDAWQAGGYAAVLVRC